MNHFIILAFGSLQMENNGLFTGNSSNFWSKDFSATSSYSNLYCNNHFATDKRTKATQKHIGENHSIEFVSLG